MDFPQYTDYRPTTSDLSDPGARRHPTLGPITSAGRVIPLGAPRIEERVLAGAAHLSALVLGIFGPLVFWALARPGGSLRREAAKAFNSTAVLGVATVGGTIILSPFDIAGGWFIVGFMTWFVLTVIGAVHAFHGEDRDEPITRKLPWRPLDDGAPRGH